MGGAVGCLVPVLLLVVLIYGQLPRRHHAHPGVGAEADVVASLSSPSSAGLPELQQKVASLVVLPLVGMLGGSACFPGALPAYALPIMQVRRGQ